MEQPLKQKQSKPRPSGLELKLAHSPDSDDAFMFYGLATRKIPTGNLRFTHVLEDIQTLNEKALGEAYDITALSFHAYAYLARAYTLLPCGASFGERYGPLVVAPRPLDPADLRGKRVAVPGKMTTAWLALQLYQPQTTPVFAPFDKITSLVTSGKADAGLIIHEGQLTYAQQGLSKVVDLGEWWHQETGLPLPLGGNAIRRALGREVHQQVTKLMLASIQYALDHREEALLYALQFARGIETHVADQFVSMYVNHWTLDCGERGRRAIQTLLDRGFEKGILPSQVTADFVERRV
jgi:1,4-dihydroxy-6-naphthoate synthase